MFLTLLLSFVISPSWAEPRLRIAPARIASTTQTEQGMLADLDGARVFIKMVSFGPAPCAEILREARMSQLISPTGIGPRFYGRVDVPVLNLDRQRFLSSYGLVYEYVEGHVLRGVIETDANEDWVGFLPEVEVSADARLRPRTLTDVIRAFDTLEALKIEGQDIQFLITPDGHARLIDYGIYERTRTSATARARMREEREALVEGLRRRLD